MTITVEGVVKPSALGYVSVPGWLDEDAASAALGRWTRDLSSLAHREGYVLVGVFSDVRDTTEGGLYRMLEVVKDGSIRSVLSPSLEHLGHVGCLRGADRLTVARYLRTPLLMFSDSMALRP